MHSQGWGRHATQDFCHQVIPLLSIFSICCFALCSDCSPALACRARQIA